MSQSKKKGKSWEINIMSEHLLSGKFVVGSYKKYTKYTLKKLQQSINM